MPEAGVDAFLAQNTRRAAAARAAAGQGAPYMVCSLQPGTQTQQILIPCWSKAGFTAPTAPAPCLGTGPRGAAADALDGELERRRDAGLERRARGRVEGRERERGERRDEGEA